MTDPVIRPRNTVALLKIETTEGTDASPVAADAFPFELDDFQYNHPFGSEASGESTGSLVAGADLVIGQPANLRFRCRLKGANATYSASVKPPHHALLSICGKRGQFTDAIAASALAAGTALSATLGTGFTGTAELYTGQPLVFAGDAAGFIPLVTGFTAGKVATLTDTFSPVLDTSTTAAIPKNWTYFGTSPRESSERATDHPSGTIYIYEDGTLMKFLACRGKITELAASAGKPGFMTAQINGIFAGAFRTDAAIPSGLPDFSYGAPQFQMGSAGVNNACSVDRMALPVSRFTIADNQEGESPDDPNTSYGFGAGQIGGRRAILSVDPLQTLVATRDALAAIGTGSNLVGVMRSATAIAANRWAIMLPTLQPVDSQPGRRGMNRSDQQTFRMLSSGREAQTRDMDWSLSFY